MSVRTIVVLFVIFFCAASTSAQLFERKDIPFYVDGVVQSNMNTGGLNAPQFSDVDLNNDGVQDLFLFDRTGDVRLTFLRSEESTSGYTFAPEYTANFPILSNWVLLRDYNADGIMDLFAYSDVPGVDGIMAYTGYYDNDDKIAFERYQFNEQFNLIFFPLNSGGRTQLFISKIDYPAVVDVDCDGDLDILTFAIAGGNVEFYKNQSVEQGYGLDSLIFELEESCWGGFYESGITELVDLSDQAGQCFDNITTGEITFRHAGSTLLVFDADNDDDQELVLGDVSFSNLVMLENGGSCDEPWMNEQISFFPEGNQPTDIPLFPSSFLLDVTHDGIKDLVASPNLRQNAEDKEVVWLYENIGTNAVPEFTFVEDDFLVKEMVDFGTGAHPAFVDYNADGLMDIIVGNFSFFEPFGAKNAALFLFENTGTRSAPVFELVDEDFLGMNQFSSNSYNFVPTFGDLDADGDLDILVGEEFGQLFYAENTAGPGNPMTFGNWQYGYMSIDIGQASAPYIVDLDRDGKLDLVVGERSGNINFFKNTGTTTEAAFLPSSSDAPNIFQLGGIDTRIPGGTEGHSAPVVLEVNGEYVLITGTDHGQLEKYLVQSNDLSGDFVEEDLFWGDIDEGSWSHTAFYDIDNDGAIEALVGNRRGGLSFFTTDIMTTPVSSEEIITSGLLFDLFPNPTNDYLLIRDRNTTGTGIDKVLEIRNAQGQLIDTQQWSDDQIQLNLSTYPSGLYLVKIQWGSQEVLHKVLVTSTK